jgi:Phenylalanyl-tRNA synthetase beta subunit
MKISYEHLKKNIEEKPSLSNISNSLFQLGHEHTIEDNIFDIEFTPNRGDCLSIRGLLRDLNAFYISKIDNSIFNKPIDNFDFNFKNSIPKICPNISFLKIEIEKINQDYSGPLKKYFEDMKLNKNNFFTDISNYIS